MILLQFNIYNPWSDTWTILWNKSGSFSKNKAFEFNGYRTNRIITVDFDLTFRGDHAGARVMLGLVGYDIELHFYDTRHWNYNTNTWETYK